MFLRNPLNLLRAILFVLVQNFADSHPHLHAVSTYSQNSFFKNFFVNDQTTICTVSPIEFLMTTVLIFYQNSGHFESINRDCILFSAFGAGSVLQKKAKQNRHQMLNLIQFFDIPCCSIYCIIKNYSF